MSQQITVSGNVTLASTMGVAGSGALLVNTTSTLTSNGKAWPNAFTLNGNATYTLADNWNADGLLTVGTNSQTINGFQITASAGLTVATGVVIVAGTTNIILDGTGTVTGSNSTLRNNLTINTAGTLTFASGNTFSYNTGTFTYTAGTVVTTGNTFSNNAIAVTLACSGITWNNVTLTGNVTVTLSENLNASGLLTLVSSSQIMTLTGNTINASGGVRYGGTTGTSSGTTVINVIATQTLDGPSTTTGGINNPITINVPGGTVTIATVGDTPFRGLLDKLNYVAGTIVTDRGTWSTP